MAPGSSNSLVLEGELFWGRDFRGEASEKEPRLGKSIKGTTGPSELRAPRKLLKEPVGRTRSQVPLPAKKLRVGGAGK